MYNFNLNGFWLYEDWALQATKSSLLLSRCITSFMKLSISDLQVILVAFLFSVDKLTWEP